MNRHGFGHKSKKNVVNDALFKRLYDKNIARHDRLFTRAAHCCGMSRNQLTRIYYRHWLGVSDREGFSRDILAGRMLYEPEARGFFYEVEAGNNWYPLWNGNCRFYRGQHAGKLFNWQTGVIA